MATDKTQGLPHVAAATDAMVNDIFDEIIEKAPFPWKNEVVSQRLISEVNKKIGR